MLRSLVALPFLLGLAVAQQSSSPGEWLARRVTKVELNNADAREALRAVFGSAGASYVVDPEVTGKVTASFPDATLGSALPPLLRQMNATYRLESGVFTILPLVSSFPALGDDGKLRDVAIVDVEIADAVRRLPTSKPVAVMPGVSGQVSVSSDSISADEALRAMAGQVDAWVVERDSVFTIVPLRSLRKPLPILRKTDADLRQVVTELMASTGVNFVISGGIAGRTTANLVGTDVQSALEAILAPIGGKISMRRGIFVVSAR